MFEYLIKIVLGGVVLYVAVLVALDSRKDSFTYDEKENDETN